MNTDTIPIRFGQIVGLPRLNLSRIITAHNRCPRRRVSTMIEAIIEAVCAEFDVGSDELLSKRRSNRIAWPRQVAMTLAYRLKLGSGNEVANFFGRGDHATVCYALQRVDDRCDTEPETKARVERIASKLRERT